MNVAVSPRSYSHYTAVQMVWDDEMVQRLVALRGEKKSFSACAAVLGVTRNAAIGIANRQRQKGNEDSPLCDPNGERKGKGKLKPRVASATKELRPRPRLVVDRRVSDLPLFSHRARYLAFGPVTKGVAITAVGARECKYIAGSDRLCCGHETEPGSPWCTYHARMIYSPRTQAHRRAGGTFVKQHHFAVGRPRPKPPEPPVVVAPEPEVVPPRAPVRVLRGEPGWVSPPRPVPARRPEPPGGWPDDDDLSFLDRPAKIPQAEFARRPGRR